MRLFSRFPRQAPALSQQEIGAIRERVREMRREVSRRDLELADLFALVREDERPVLRHIEPVRRPDVERLWPNQVPTEHRFEAEPAGYTQAPSEGWQPFRETGLSTSP